MWGTMGHKDGGGDCCYIKKKKKSKKQNKHVKKSELTTLHNAKKHIEKGQKHLGELWEDHSSQRDIKGQKKAK